MRKSAANGRRTWAGSCAAFTFIENVFAVGIVAVFFVALWAMNSKCLYMLNAGREAEFAAQSLQDRIEQLRSLSWANLTNASYLQNSVLNTPASGALQLSQVTETLTVNAYPTALSPAISVVRSNGTTTANSSNAAIANGDMVRVDIALSWTGIGKRTRSQAATSLIEKINP